MARRLTLENETQVLGVYEAKSTFLRVSRNIVQCLHDFNPPSASPTTIARVFGDETGWRPWKFAGQVDENRQAYRRHRTGYRMRHGNSFRGTHTEKKKPRRCWGSQMDAATRRAGKADQHFTDFRARGFSRGILHVNDLVDYVSEKRGK